jgi:predicted ATPase with chaperone activity
LVGLRHVEGSALLVGLPEAAVKESTHRVERAIVNSGFSGHTTAWSLIWHPRNYPSGR